MAGIRESDRVVWHPWPIRLDKGMRDANAPQPHLPDLLELTGGGAGAMQPFGRRIGQEDILKVMAYIDTFRSKE